MNSLKLILLKLNQTRKVNIRGECLRWDPCWGGVSPGCMIVEKLWKTFYNFNLTFRLTSIVAGDYD
jgi:hypothetical protein